MKEIIMQVVNEEEAWEYCNTHGYSLVSVEENSHGDLEMLALDMHSKKSDSADELSDIELAGMQPCIIFAKTIHGKMYLANKKCSQPTTFDRQYAQKFRHIDGQRKAAFMSMNGKYHWEIEDIT